MATVPPTHLPFAVGLTGGIASGKTTVSELFKNLGIEVIDADVIAHELVQPNMPAYNAIIEHFGTTVTHENGTLNRKKLRQLAFTDVANKVWLEKCLHPKIRERMQQALKKSTTPYVILAIPLLIETLPNPLIQHILVIETPHKLRLQRLMQRDNCNSEIAQKIMAQQVSDENRRKHADDILINNGDLEQLKTNVLKLHQKYLKIASSMHQT